MVLRTIVDVDVHVQGDEEEVHRQQQGSYLEKSFFHVAKIVIFTIYMVIYSFFFEQCFSIKSKYIIFNR